MNRGVNVVIQTLAKERRIFYAKPFQNVKLNPGKSHSYEWYDNNELKGEPVTRIPLREVGVYRVTIYERNAIVTPPSKNNDPNFITGPFIVDVMDTKHFDQEAEAKYCIYDLHNVFPTPGRVHNFKYGFDNNQTIPWTVSLGQATVFLDLL